jgi:uncharacterized cupin superfamily protein
MIKIFKSQEFIQMSNPTPGETYKEDLLKKLNARTLSGVFGLVIPGGEGGKYHVHEKGEHIIFILGGEGIELVEGEEIPVKAGDILFVPAGVKHTTLNRSKDELRYIGFFTGTPGQKDRVELG